MKSLLRVSSDQSDAISFVPDDETVLFGEIWRRVLRSYQIGLLSMRI
jgi:hypothetical protein